MAQAASHTSWLAGTAWQAATDTKEVAALVTRWAAEAAEKKAKALEEEERAAAKPASGTGLSTLQAAVLTKSTTDVVVFAEAVGPDVVVFAEACGPLHTRLVDFSARVQAQASEAVQLLKRRSRQGSLPGQRRGLASSWGW